jgi:hypothetical protein|mmetsp:Transcript_116949/g.183947  ORF Transcript_116949/g.183947 Transcript_116949/m.183947 type:complete len:1628 (+) Transcript_116949:158-5041(+)
MAALQTAPVEKDALFEALSANAAEDNPEDRSAENEVKALGHDEEDQSIDGEEQVLMEQEEDAEDRDSPGDTAFQRFMEGSDEEEDAALDDLRIDETMPEPLRRPKRPGEILSTGRSHPEVKRVVADQRQLKDFERLKHDVAAKESAAEDARDSLEIEEQKLRALRKQVAQGQPGDDARITYQKQEVAQALARLTEVEKARDLAALALHKYHLSDEIAAIGNQADDEVQHHAAVAQRHKVDEVHRAKKVINAERMAREASREQEMLWNEEIQRREEAADYHHALGKRRLKAAQIQIAEKQRQAEEVRESKFQHDAQRVLQLKESVDKINRQINGQNESRKKKHQKVQQEREQRKRDMLNEGKNPYEEWRKEEIAADKDKQEQLLKQKTIMRNEKLVEQLLREDKRYKEQRKVLQEKRETEDKFQKEMGNYAREKRIANYIRKVTIGNVDVLDPTGTAIRIDASKVTVQKTHAFGLGKVRPEEIDKVERDLKKAKTQMAKWRPPRPTDEADIIDDVPIVEASGESEELLEGKLAIPKLSTLEEKYLAAARERQKANICSIQRCWGKEFKGDAFIAKPSVITFFDFEVGKKYRQVVEVTNVSLTFNQFKLLPLDNKYKDFFDIVFVPPGRMSAGVTRYITIWFTPKVYEDIDTTFPILAKTGHIDFPLLCKTKKTVLTITPQDADAHAVVDFGQILYGEQGQQVLQIKNSGALSTDFKLEAIENDCAFLDMMSWKPERGEFSAHTTSKITFNFKPTAVGTFATMLTLSVDNGAQGDAKLAKEWTVLVRGSCIDVPIYVEQEEYDVKTILFEHTFRENIVLHNRQSVAMKITVADPQPIDGEMQLNPTVAYIQGNQSQAVQIKFSPKFDFLDRNPQYRDKKRPDVEGAFRIKFKIVGADQKLPVYTEFVGILTTNTVSFQPSVLKFGSCFIGSAATSTLTIKNESCLPQRYCFVRQPSFLKVEDFPGDVIEEEDANAATWGCGTAVLDDGGYGALGLLLPKEERRVCISYCPESATEMDYAMTFKVITGKLCTRTFSIPCKGQGRQPPITFSTTELQLASIPCDSTCKDSIEITNKSGVSYAINLLVPPYETSALQVSPVCCTLEPDETKRLQVEFKPKEDYIKFLEGGEVPPLVEALEGEEVPPPAEVIAGEEKTPPKVTPEEFKRERLKDIRTHGGRRWEVCQSETGRSIHASWKIPMCIRVKPDDVDLQASMAVVTMYSCVRTCVLPSVLRADPVRADFGEVTALQREVMCITLQNMFPGDAQELHMEPLPENACFTVLNAPRTIGKELFKLMIEFKPEFVQIYESVLKLYTQNTRVQIPLKGKGVRPVLKIKPESGVLQLGALMYNKACTDHTEQKLEIENDSPFELCYNLDTIIAAEPHHVGPPPFTLTPSSGVVPGHGSKTVKVTFRPHRPLAVFREKLLVNVPNQRKPTHVYLYGHCFTQQTYCMPDLAFEPFGGAEAKASSAFLDSIAVGSGAAVGSDGHFAYKNAQQSEFSLVFEQGEVVKYLLVGACFPAGYQPTAPAQNSPATTFDFQIQQSEFSSYFTVEAPGAAAGKGGAPVKPGEAALKVAFRYKPPETSSLTVGDMELDLLSGIGKWITCKVKGSLLDGPAAQEISVELKAYLQQI